MAMVTLRTTTFECTVPSLKSLPPDDQLGLIHAHQRGTGVYEAILMLLNKLPENKAAEFEALNMDDAIDVLIEWVNAE
jgi:hypothetical protein